MDEQLPPYVNLILEKIIGRIEETEETNRKKFEETNKKIDLLLRQQTSAFSSSTMTVEKLKQLFKALNISGPFGSRTELKQLGELAKDKNAKEFKWIGREPENESQYLAHISEKLYFGESSIFCVTDASKEALVTAEGEKYSAKSDALIILKSADGPGRSQYALAGFELKQSLSSPSSFISQAASEWAVIASKSNVPYVQLLTDLNSGGIAFYLCQEKPTLAVQYRVFLTMASFWEFLQQICQSVENEMEKTETLYPIINTISSTDLDKEHPLQRFRFSSDGTNFQSYPIITEWLLERLEPANDIACLKDLEDYPELASDTSSFHRREDET
eukprot:CAMPEP_0184646402 /NCGR_PEP_ID=MMETSP0308-20130426/3112_1 /TAXON_ID=38269 /ORGANISM="Gloeochaete witrockiana, Strain SAG 46.84" /LENGTH=330 /DNA_ID=CAMNT_0027076399 /DNA_START=77 /DNA_END=1070 /DNA_ORIENTATION=-